MSAILDFGGHLELPKDANLASSGFQIKIPIPTYFCKNIFYRHYCTVILGLCRTTSTHELLTTMLNHKTNKQKLDLSLCFQTGLDTNKMTILGLAGPSGRASDSKSRGPGFNPSGAGGCVLEQASLILHDIVLVNT